MRNTDSLKDQDMDQEDVEAVRADARDGTSAEMKESVVPAESFS